MITEKDFDSIKADGRSLELIKRQYEYLVGKKIKISGIRPAIIGDGILEMDTKEKNKALQYFNTNSEKKRWIKFVPASGVASRMFSSLQNYIQVSEQPNFDLSKYFESEEGTVIQKLKKQFKKLPFFETIFSSLSGEIDQEIMNRKAKRKNMKKKSDIQGDVVEGFKGASSPIALRVKGVRGGSPPARRRRG